MKQKTVDTMGEEDKFDGISNDLLNMLYDDLEEEATPTPMDFVYW